VQLEAAQAKLDDGQAKLEGERAWLTEQQRTLAKDQDTLAAWHSDQVRVVDGRARLAGSDVSTRACLHVVLQTLCPGLRPSPDQQAAALEELGARDAELTAQQAALEQQAAKLQAWDDEVRCG
jgi:septal ring factor EnvC (AmiA/AmiB activator)